MQNESICRDSKENSKVILVSCSGMCVHGQISREAVHDVIYEKVKDKTDWICPIAIPAKIEWQVKRLKNAQAIIAVPGCPVYCDVKILKEAGFEPTKIVDAHEICDFKPGSMELTDIPLPERRELINRLSEAVEDAVQSVLSCSCQGGNA